MAERTTETYDMLPTKSGFGNLLNLPGFVKNSGYLEVTQVLSVHAISIKTKYVCEKFLMTFK